MFVSAQKATLPKATSLTLSGGSEGDDWATAIAGGGEEVVGEVRLKQHNPTHGAATKLNTHDRLAANPEMPTPGMLREPAPPAECRMRCLPTLQGFSLAVNVPPRNIDLPRGFVI